MVRLCVQESGSLPGVKIAAALAWLMSFGLSLIFTPEALSSDFRFEANRGQVQPASVEYIVQGSKIPIHLSRSRLTVPSTPVPLTIHFENSSTAAIAPLEEMKARTHYYTGEQNEWRTDIPNYRRVLYRSVYPGIDLLFYGKDGELEFDFILSPGADPDAIAMKFDGHGDLTLSGSGELLLAAGGGQVRLSAPHLFQEHQGRRRPVTGRFVLKEAGRVGLQVDDYDRTRPLVIDPVLTYSSYADAGGTDRPSGIAVDAAGNIYISADGHTQDRSTLTVRKLTALREAEYFVTLSGNALFHPTGAIAVDAGGNAYLTGGVQGWSDGAADPGFPQINPLQAGYRGNGDAVLVKLNPQGRILFSTYLGWTGPDFGTGLAIDAENNVYVAGTTGATGASGGRAFLTKVNQAGTAILYSTIIDRSSGSGAAGATVHVRVDSAGNMYAAGSDGIAGWVVKLNSSGSSLLSKDLVINGNVLVRDLSIDAEGHVYLATVEQIPSGAAPAGALRKYDPAMTGTIYEIVSEHLGALNAIAVDPTGSVYLTGQASAGFPIINSFALHAGNDLFAMKLTPDGRDIVYSTVLNGTNAGSDGEGSEPKYARGIDIAVDASGRAYIAGETNAANFPATNGTNLSNGAFSMQDTIVLVLDPIQSGRARRYSRLDEFHAALKYEGSWPTISGSARMANDEGARVSITFTGTDVAWVSRRSEWSGIARIYLDGKLIREVDTYASPPRDGVEEWINGLSCGTHTLTIEVTGRKGASAQAPWVWVDSFVIYSDGDARFGR